MTSKRFAAAFAALALLLFTGVATLAQVGGPSAAAATSRLFPPNGEAGGRAARAAYAKVLQNAGNPLAPAPPEVLESAKAAYVREPLQPDLVAVLASPMVARENDARAIELLSAGHGFTRRSTLLNSQLMTVYARNRQMAPAFALIDEILRRETAAHGEILKSLAQFAGNPAYAPTILGILDSKVPWSAQFWRQLAQSVPGLGNAADLRIGYARQGGIGTPEIDRMLVIGLAGQARFGDAERLARVLFPQAMRARLPARGNLLANGDFASPPDILPFDWDVRSGGDYSAQIPWGRSELAISALSGARAVVSRQLVRLRPTELAVSVDSSAASSNGLGELKARLVCASGDQRPLLEASAIGLSRTIPAPGCEWAWFEIEAAIPSDGSSQDWVVRRVVLRSVN